MAPVQTSCHFVRNDTCKNYFNIRPMSASVGVLSVVLNLFLSSQPG